jgi:5'-nucleotidase
VVPEDFGATAEAYLTAAKDFPFLRCFCDLDITAPGPSFVSRCKNPSTYVPGKCAREIHEASEKDDVGQVLNNPYTGSLPLGAANLLLQVCDKKLCTEECLPEASVGVVAQITGDIPQTPNDADESPLGDLIADSQRFATGTDFAFINRLAFVSTYAPIGLLYSAAPGRPADADGRVLESEVRNVLFGMDPVADAVNVYGGSHLVTLQLTGQQIYDTLSKPLTIDVLSAGPLDVSGLTYTWDAGLPTASRVTDVRKNGVPIDKAGRFTVTVNDFLAKAIVGAEQVVLTEKNPEKELVAYLKAQPQPIAPPPSNRVTRLN